MPAFVKALALALFIAGIAGATYGVTTVLGDTVESSLLTVTSPRAVLNATGGHNVTFLVTVHNRDTVARDVVLEAVGAASGRSEVTTVRGASNTTAFLTVSIPEGLPPGDHSLDVQVISDGRVLRERNGVLTLHLLPEGEGFQDGDAAAVLYTGRLTATGRVFNTNDRGLVGLTIPKTDTYRFSEGFLEVLTRPRLSVVPGLARGMLGQQVGEWRTISFPPSQGYGPATTDEIFNRDDVLQRDLTVANDEQQVPRETFNTYIRESRQGDPRTFDVNSTFKLDQDGIVWPYRVTNITDQVVSYKLDAQVGDSFTIYPFWANSSVITQIDEERVTFRTTPTTQPGQRITIKAFWPEMSTLKEFNETAIVVRNDPPVGYTFTQIIGGQPRQATVKEVNETRIVAVLPAANPLAGKDLTFDVLILDLQKGSNPSG